MSMNKHVQDVLFILAVSNSVVNPVIYGRYSIPCCRNFLQSRTVQRRQQQILQQQQMAYMANREETAEQTASGSKQVRLPVYSVSSRVAKGNLRGLFWALKGDIPRKAGDFLSVERARGESCLALVV